jgi:hypothetical protein
MIEAAMMDPVQNKAYRLTGSKGVTFIAVVRDGTNLMFTVGDDGSYVIATIAGDIKKRGWISELLAGDESSEDSSQPAESEAPTQQ